VCLQVTSYGGKLTYTVQFEVPRDTPAQGLVTADVRLEVCVVVVVVVAVVVVVNK